MTYGGVEVQLHTFLTSALGGGEWSVLHPGYFIPGERAPGTHWVGPRANLYMGMRRKNPCPYSESNPDHPSNLWLKSR